MTSTGDVATSTSIILPGFYPTSDSDGSAHTSQQNTKIGPVGGGPALDLSMIPKISISGAKLVSLYMIVSSFIILINIWAILWVYKNRKDKKVTFTSLEIAKESKFISMQIAIIFIIFGVCVLTGVMMIRRGKPIFYLVMVMDILMHLVLFTLAIWCCFLAKEKVEVYLNYVYKADDAYSRIQILLMYTILACLFSLLV